MNKKALVIGLGVSGLHAMQLLRREGYQVTIVDKNQTAARDLPPDVTFCPEGEVPSFH